MSAVFLYVLDPALEGISDERGAATLYACQHAHVTGSAVALDDGQALVLDETREGVRVVEADDARHELVTRCAQPPVRALGRARRAVAGGSGDQQVPARPKAAPDLCDEGSGIREVL